MDREQSQSSDEVLQGISHRSYHRVRTYLHVHAGMSSLELPPSDRSSGFTPGLTHSGTSANCQAPESTVQEVLLLLENASRGIFPS